MSLNPLMALSTLDGRYRKIIEPLSEFLSEYALIKHRVFVECEWFKALITQAKLPELKHLKPQDYDLLNFIPEQFGLDQAQCVKAIERKTNHDVKAVEYFLKEQFQDTPLAPYAEWIHFGCTSEDVNNLATALMLKSAVSYLQTQLQTLLEQLTNMAKTHAALPMLSRTHGQTATPTTVGKELGNIAYRLKRQMRHLEQAEFLGKMGGAVGNFNAHIVAYPEHSWPEIAEQFVSGLGLSYNPMTTQIEPHDFMAEIAHTLIQAHSILLDASRDLWGYISLGYFKQKTKAGEVGSSTMPHKVNPIDFENAEGNLGLANALLSHLAQKLPISRWQRDLSDSTVLRNLGQALGYAALAYASFGKGLNKLDVNIARLEEDLNNAPEVLTEAIQTVMRRYGLPEPYEQLKALSRGKPISLELIQEFISGLYLPEEAKKSLLKLSPQSYIGLSESLVACRLN